jgi:hypothetical protein
VSVADKLRIPAGWRGETDQVPAAGGGTARLGIRPARTGDLVDAYPAGADDEELAIGGEPELQAVRDYVADVLEHHPRCRRVVLAVPERDLEAIGWAEDAGFRFVVDVETRAGAHSLLVVEPDWVLAQPHALEDIPIKE